MKKRLISLAAFGAMTLSGFAQAESVYTLNGFGDDILDLFSDALDKGRKYPTPEEFEAAGYDLTEINFVRSHVRPRSIMVDHSKDVNQDVQEGRKLWMNVPIGIGKHQGGYPSTNFADDTFTGWNYTNVFGSWNHALFHVPGVATDCAHKNGSDIYSGIKFFESWTAGSGAAGWVGKVQTKDASRYGGYKYVEPLINALMFFGQDGINYNFEDTGYQEADVVGFHQAAYRLAKERGFDNFHIGIYTQTAAIVNQNFCKAVLGTKETGKTADAFLNYASSDFSSQISISATNAEKWFGDASDVYQGAWIVGMNRTWSNLNKDANAKKVGVVLWGEHSQSRLLSYNQGNSEIDFQENYQKLQERFFSGGYRNPATRPTPTNNANWQMEDPAQDGLRTFQGLAEYIPERTAIQQNLPFTTYFNIGSGERYNYKGSRTHGRWYNLGQQDVVPTYRWLVYQKGTTTAVKDGAGIPEFTPSDAYIGGSCLRLTNTQAIDINLYRAELKCTSGTPRVTVALKFPPQGTTEDNVKYEKQKSALSVIVRKKGNSSWLETPLALTTTNEWEEQTVALNGVAQGDVIEYVGLRTAGDTNGLLVGMLSLNDDSQVTPAPVKDFVPSVLNETDSKYSVKMRWDVDATATTRADYGLVYNDEAGIDHFEVLYKNGAEGRVCELARTTTWSAFVGDIEKPAGTLDAYIGVRAASVDGKTYSDILWSKLNVSPSGTGGSSTGDEVIDYPLVEGAPVVAANYVNMLQTAGAVQNIAQKTFSTNPSSANAHNYYLHNETVELEQGSTFRLLNGLTDGLKKAQVHVYADWDGNKDFTSQPDELLWEGSTAKDFNAALSAYVWTLKVPADARTGEARLRVVYDEPVSKGVYTIKLANTSSNYYFSTTEVTDNETTTYSLSTSPEQFYIEPVNGGFTIQSKTTGKYAGYNQTTSWDFSNQPDVWTIGNIEGATTTILKDGKVGFGCDAVGQGKGVYTDKKYDGKSLYQWVITKVDEEVGEHTGSCGAAHNGYAIDIPLRITGSNPQREKPVMAAAHEYPIIEIDRNSENWQTALAQRWFKTLESSGANANISAAWSESPTGTNIKTDLCTNYVLVDQTIKARQGQTVTLSWTDARSGDGLNYCTGRGYADWDCDGLFNAGNDELIWSCGVSNEKKQNTALTSPYSFGFTIPADAVPGASRVRLVFSDAWFPHPGATGGTAKGFAIDIPLEITGTNPARKPALDTPDLDDRQQPDGCWLWGDMNDDGRLTIGDVTDVISLLLGRPSANIRRKKAAEVDGTTPADAPSRVAGKILERQ